MSLLLCLFALLGLTIGQSTECEVCEFVVKGAAGLLNNNETESEIASFLSDACSILPGGLSSDCNAFIKQFAPQFFRMLVDGQAPETICKELGACAATLKPVKRATEQSLACQICSYVVGYVETYIQQNQTEQQIIKNLEAVCADFGPFSSECDSFVELYVPQLIKWILAGENPQMFCKQVGLCTSTNKFSIDIKRTILQGGCSVCQLVATYVEQYAAANATEAEIENELDQLCNLLGPLGGTCTSFVAQYLPQLIQWCENKEPPLQFCTEIGLCSSKAVFLKRSGQQSGTCSICELILTFVEQYIAANATEKVIIDDCTQLCTLLGPLASECDMFVNQYVPQMIQYLLNKEPPEQFCSSIGLCSSGFKKPILETQKRAVQQAACSICQLVATYVEQYVAANATEAEIEKEIMQLCSLLGPLGPECNMFVQQYLPALIQWCINKEPPQQFCTQIGLCSSSTEVTDLISKFKGYLPLRKE